MSNVLILDCGTQGQICAKSLKKAGNKVFLIHHEKHNYTDDSRYVDKKFQCVEGKETQTYIDLVVEVTKNYAIDAIIPMGDAAALFLSQHKDLLQPIVNYILPDESVFEKGYDKNSLMTLCAEKGYPHPFTVNNVSDLDDIDCESLPYPLLIKPNHTCGGRGMTLVRNASELKEKFGVVSGQYGDCHLQQYIRQGGKQVEVQVYINDRQELVASSVISKYRWYPENGGSSCCATAVKNDDVVNICYNILKDIGWVGFADFDLIEDPDEGNLKVMELNPRVPACVKAAVMSGTDWPNIIVNEYMGKPHKESIFKSGVLLKHFGMEALWFYYSKNRFKSKPSLLKIFGKGVCYQDLDFSDIKPFIRGTWHNITRQLDPSFRKSKSGTR